MQTGVLDIARDPNSVGIPAKVPSLLASEGSMKFNVDVSAFGKPDPAGQV